MDVPQIEEVRLSAEIAKTDERESIKTSEAQKRKCVYNKDMTCQVPDCKMEICGNCPYGRNYSFSSTVKDVFGKIISMSIFLAKSDDVLRDVVALMAKGNGKEELGELEGKEGEKVKEVKEGEEEGKGEQVKGTRDKGRGIESAPDAMPIIKPVNIKDVKVEALSARQIMTKILSKKVADINEALANPNGPEKPLV